MRRNGVKDLVLQSVQFYLATHGCHYRFHTCTPGTVSSTRFQSQIRSLPRSRESPSIESSFTFKGHISQSCSADIRSLHSFLAGSRRQSQAVADSFSVPPPGAYILLHGWGQTRLQHPLLSTWDRPVYRAPFICSPIHRDTITSMAQGPSARPPHPSIFGMAKTRISSRYQSKGKYMTRFTTQFITQLDFFI